MKIILQSILAIVFLSGAIGCHEDKMSDDSNLKFNRQVVLSYLVQPRFSSTDLFQQITKTKASLELYDMDQEMIYLSLRKGEGSQAALAALTLKPQSAEFAKLSPDKGSLVLGGYSLSKPGCMLFRVKADDLIINPDAVARVPFFGGLSYDITMPELADFGSNRSLALGLVRLPLRSTPDSIETVFSFGPYVAKKGEGSLTRLANQIVAPGDTNETASQKLLDFVTRNISYDKDEHEWSSAAQVIKRPNEVLLTRTATCASLATLYASLLEQKGNTLPASLHA